MDLLLGDLILINWYTGARQNIKDGHFPPKKKCRFITIAVDNSIGIILDLTVAFIMYMRDVVFSCPFHKGKIIITLQRGCFLNYRPIRCSNNVNIRK